MIENMWYAIFPSKGVKKGSLLAVRRLGLDLVLFRTESGVLSALVDQCSHRGVALSIGKLKGDCVQCPFHAIEFDASGKCQFIPANGIQSKEDLTRYNVKSYPVLEKNDIIYLWYGNGPVTKQEPPFFNDYLDEGYVFSEIEDHWNSHYSRCIENQLDVVHIPFVHHNTIGRGNKTLINGPKVLFEDETLITSANNALDVGQVPKPAAECELKSTFLAFRYPNIWMNHISDKIKVIIYFAPVDDENTVLYIRFYCKLSKVRLLNKGIAFTGKFANKIIERQDKRVVITQKPKMSGLKCGEHLIAGDGPIVKYRMLRDGYQKAALKNV